MRNIDYQHPESECKYCNGCNGLRCYNYNSPCFGYYCGEYPGTGYHPQEYWEALEQAEETKESK